MGIRSLTRGGIRAVSGRGQGATIRTMSAQTGAGVQQTAKAGATGGTVMESYEGDISAVDTWTALNSQAGAAQTMIIPEGVTRISGIEIDVAVDLGTSAVSVRVSTQVKLSGRGFPGGPHVMGGPSGGIAAFGTSTGAVALPLTKSYDGLNLPVNSGSTFSIEGVLVGEDPGDVTMTVTVLFES